MATGTKRKPRQPGATRGSGNADTSAEEERLKAEERLREEGAADERRRSKERASEERARTRRQKMRSESQAQGAKQRASQERAKTRRAKMASEGRQARTDAEREAARQRHQRETQRIKLREREQGTREQRAKARAQANRNALLVSRGRSRPLSTGTTSSEGAALIPSGPNKSTSSKVILGAMVLSMIVIAYRNAKGGTTPATTIPMKGGAPLKVPTHLRQFAGVLLMGTIALVVNEIDPGLGMAFGILILVDTGVEGLANSLSTNLFGGGAPAAAPVQRSPIALGPKGPSGYQQTLPGFNPNPSGGAAGPGGPTPFGSG
jgi:hypothetical protein